MEFHPIRLDALHAVLSEIRPEWTRASIERAARKLPDDVTWDDFVTRVVRAALDPHTASPGRLVKAWDEYASGVPVPGDPPDDKRFTPGTRIRKDDPYPEDRDPVTGRTDPARQRARIMNLVGAYRSPVDDRDEPLHPPPPGYESWEAAGRAMLSGRMSRAERADIASYSRGLDR